jgi:hypothetical protein
MPSIAERKSYNGAEQRIERLGLGPLWDELTVILTGFQLLVAEARDANGGAAVREFIDVRFDKSAGWNKSQTGDVDWVKCRTVNGTRVCLGVEIQMSARSDLVIIDVVHLRDRINAGLIDVGVLVTPSDALSIFLTDRAPGFSDAVVAVERARAQDLPLIILGLSHDGPGEPLAKKKTRQGRGIINEKSPPKSTRRKKS